MLLSRGTPWGRFIFKPRAHFKTAPSCLILNHLSSSSNPRDPLIYPDAPSTNHSDLGSFLSYAERTGLDAKSTVYVGTHYEYTVARSLSRYGISLRRVGGSSDRGTDLLGVWDLPQTNTSLRVLVQCKAGVSQGVGPQYVRELEGAFAGAPPGWRGTEGVMAFLVGMKPATKGVRDALGRSRLPMGFVCCAGDGTVRQMLWNGRAEAERLEGWGAVMRYGSEGQELVLAKNGRPVSLLEPKG